MLADLGYATVQSSRAVANTKDEIEQWYAVFAGADLPVCSVAVHSRTSVRRFAILTGPEKAPPSALVRLDEPYSSDGATARLDGLDGRVVVLESLLRSFEMPSAPEYALYDASLRLWRSAEDMMLRTA